MLSNVHETKFLLRLANVATQTTSDIAEVFGNGRTGGYFYIGNAENQMLLHMRTGSIGQENWRKYLAFSAEKAARLHQNPDHLLSWQSRDPKKNQWGGAIRIGQSEGYFSFSGFSEELDEVCVLVWGVCTGINERYYAEKCLEISGNHNLFEEVKRITDTLRPLHTSW